MLLVLVLVGGGGETALHHMYMYRSDRWRAYRVDVVNHVLPHAGAVEDAGDAHLRVDEKGAISRSNHYDETHPSKNYR